MSSVTSRIKEIQQPRGGYIKPALFAKTVFEDGKVLNEKENVHSSVIGMVVDYMARFLMNNDAKEAFIISLFGYNARLDFLSSYIPADAIKESDILKNDKTITVETAKKLLIIQQDGKNSACNLLEQIKGLDDNSIVAACKIVTYDVWYRNPAVAMLAKNAEDTNPDHETIDNIRILIQRSNAFLKEFGPITVDGFTFLEKDSNGTVIHTGYTDTVDCGDGDFLTKDTIWDFKVSKSPITNKHTLQLLMYYIMGKHSRMEIYKNISKLGFFNPRLNTMYVLNTSEIPHEIIKSVEQEVLCY